MDREAVPERIEIARQRRGMTKISLAEALCLSPRDLRRIMTNDGPQPENFLDRLSSALRMAPSFFLGEAISAPQNVSFRSRASMTARQADAGIAAGAYGVMIARWLDKTYPSARRPLNVPNLTGENPEIAAEITRSEMGLTADVVPHMVGLLEKSGIRVFALDEGTVRLAAFCFWENGEPFVLLDQGRSGEASRFDAAHELGHLVLHREGIPGGKLVEDEANQFASAFLMPRPEFMRTALYPSITNLMRVKKIWATSLSSVIRRYRDVGLIDDSRYKGLLIEASRRGWLKSEPDPIVAESSTLWPVVRADMWRKGLSTDAIAAELSIPAEELDQLIWSGPVKSHSVNVQKQDAHNVVAFRRS